MCGGPEWPLITCVGNYDLNILALPVFRRLFGEQLHILRIGEKFTRRQSSIHADAAATTTIRWVVES